MSLSSILSRLNSLTNTIITKNANENNNFLKFSNALFGSGLDGEQTITDDSFITKEMHCTNCTVKAGKVLTLQSSATSGCSRLFVNNTLTLEEGARINANGNDAVNQTAGAKQDGTTGGFASTAGGAGANANANGSAGTNNSTVFAMGGVGGRGGDSATHTGAVGGTNRYMEIINGGDGTQAGAIRVVYNFFAERLGHPNGSANPILGGSGGGSGGGDEDNTKKSGAGGGGGGRILIVANKVVVPGTASMTAKGGKGGDAEGVGAGCGAGGGGGVILVYTTTSSKPDGLTIDVSGGAKSAVGATTNSTDATPGLAFWMDVYSNTITNITPA